MSKYNDLADFILHNSSKGAKLGYISSESEADDLQEYRIVLPKDYIDKKAGTNVAIKLHELGQRLRLKMVKV